MWRSNDAMATLNAAAATAEIVVSNLPVTGETMVREALSLLAEVAAD